MISIINSTIKISLIAVLATLIGYLVGINNYLTVGIIGILSVQVTKYDSLKSGLIRFLNALWALLLSFLIFLICGIEIWAFAIFLVIFVFTSLLMKTELGMVPSIVLISHVFNSTALSWGLFFEELSIMVISIGVALVVNLVYPQFWLKSMTKHLKEADQLVREQLFTLSLYLKRTDAAKDFITHQDLTNKAFEKIASTVEKLDKDKPFANDHRYLAYLYMRKTQLNAVNEMYERILKLKESHPNQMKVAQYIEGLSQDIGYEDKANKQMGILKSLINEFEQQELPKTRNEFETRAMLFQMLHDIENFLNAKLEFHDLYKDFKL
ncbi:MAG TPA: aromatic acid exporter family protein [Acholeplasma sp.]|jgi:uncharacterized membrane protein YgaE (UPF0421/DUF939 family)